MLSKYSSYILCFLISIFVVALYVNDFSPLQRLQWKIQDIMYSFRGDDNFSSDIILVNIDDKTLQEYGPWKWNRDKIGDLLAAIGSGQPKTVLLDMFIEEDTRQDTLGFTEVMAGQMSWMNNVIVPYEITPAEFRTQKISNPDNLKKYSVQVNNGLGILNNEDATLLAKRVFIPPDLICEYSSGLGFEYEVFDSDRDVRWTPLVMHYDGYYYPSAALIAAANKMGVDPATIKIFEGESVRVGNVDIPTNKHGQLFINYNKQGKSFKQVSAKDILDETIDPSIFTGKLAIISVSSKLVSDYFSTPVAPSMSEGELTANVIENILHANFITRMDASPGVDMLILFALGIIFAFILPRVSLLYRFVILMVCFFVLANLSFVLFNSYKIMAQPLYIGLELFLLLLASPFLDNEFLANLSFIGNKSDAPSFSKLPKIEVDKMQAEKDEAKGREPQHKRRPHLKANPDAALEATIAANAMPDNNDKTTKAEMSAPEDKATKQMASIEHAAVNIDDDEPEAIADVSEPSPEPEPRRQTTMQDDSQSIKNLGRYKVLEALGQGAMGKVYKGIDPAINRNVALKTIRLDFVSDPGELAELKERLFREARAAGMLSHPNIVTIYDVGTEKKLQYIAMEYLEGQTLEDMIRRKVKFNYRIISEIITQICSALDYAHNQGIVHRDIKPANIMIMNNYAVKVMDFGIARIDSTSMTRTGIAMGTPNYISPEQLQGKQVDNRCDIFSLGVVMYEMLVNRRPFIGENLTSLIYNIVNNEPDPPSSIDPSIPSLFDRVIARALQKNPNERFQKASEISTALADFIDSFHSKRSTSV